MNERIFKIALEAMDFHGAIDTDTELKLTNDHLEKFARLIVKECMSVAKGMRNPTNLNYKPSERFVDELRLHFGVEE